jgi:hypothetical protein
VRAALLALLLAAPAAAQQTAGYNPGGFFPFMPRQVFLFLRAMGKVVTLPYAYSMRLPEEGFAPALYREEPQGDTGDHDELHRLEWHALWTGHDSGGAGARYRYDTESHIGAEGLYTQLRRRGTGDLHYAHAVAHGDVAREDEWRVEYQVGAGGVAGAFHRLGPRVAFGIESFPNKPLYFEGAAGAVFASGGTIGDLRAGAGVAAGRWQLRAGWRALTAPVWHAGPDVALTVRF